MSIIEARAAALDDLVLKSGGHNPESGEFCFNEAAAWLAGEAHSDAPACVSPVLRRYTMRLNDRWDDEKRQLLLPYLVRVIGTGGDGLDDKRREVAQRSLCTDLMPAWLRIAGLDDHAERIERLADGSASDLRAALWSACDAAWAKRSEHLEVIKAKVRERLAEKPADAAAAAAAAAAAVADAAAAASYWSQYDTAYSAAYKAARAYYREHPIPVPEVVADMASRQSNVALELLDRMLEVSA